MTIKDFFSFRQNRFFWANILAMAVVVVGLLFGVLKGLDRIPVMSRLFLPAASSNIIRQPDKR